MNTDAKLSLAPLPIQKKNEQKTRKCQKTRSIKKVDLNQKHVNAIKYLNQNGKIMFQAVTKPKKLCQKPY